MAAVKALNGPGLCSAALEMAWEARSKLGASAEVRLCSQAMVTEHQGEYRFERDLRGSQPYQTECLAPTRCASTCLDLKTPKQFL